MLPLKCGAVRGESRISGRYTSLNFLILVFISSAISVSQVDVALNVLDLCVVDMYLCVFYHHHHCRRHVHLQTLIVTHQLIPVSFVVDCVVY